jgi:hypothetical protein
MLDNCLDCLATVANVIIFELLDICGIDGFTHDFVDNERIDGFLLPKLLACEVVHARDRCSIRERGGVREACRDDRRPWEAVDGDVWVARDRAILGVIEHECEVAMTSAPARCFHGGCNLGDLLFEEVDR